MHIGTCALSLWTQSSPRAHLLVQERDESSVSHHGRWKPPLHHRPRAWESTKIQYLCRKCNRQSWANAVSQSSYFCNLSSFVRFYLLSRYLRFWELQHAIQGTGEALHCQSRIIDLRCQPLLGSSYIFAKAIIRSFLISLPRKVERMFHQGKRMPLLIWT